MPRKSALKASPLVQEAEEATLLRENEIPLTLEDRTALKAFFASAAFRKALHNARLTRPSEFSPQLNTALGSVVANNRLHQMQGWKMFEAALGRQVEDPKLKPTKAEDVYADPVALP